MRSLSYFVGTALAARTVLATSPSVTINAGTVTGGLCANNSAAAYYKSIPFAQPPLNDLRFAAPTALSKFPNGTVDGTRDPPSCIQFNQLFAEAGPASEDCLYLNVWTPASATNSSSLPVRVWIYGGGNAAGGISDPLYDGCPVVYSGAVMVSINYRLGPLGFFALKDAGFNGNQGIQDILLGLQWVQDNIAAFGGDPKKVLLYGESAGAIDSFTIATLEQAPKLFGSAIYESGGGLAISNQNAVENASTSLAQNLKCGTSDKSCLQGKSIDDLNSAFANLPNSTGQETPNTPGFAPSVDGNLIPVQPTQQGVRVPSIFGSNLQEGTLFIFAQYISNPAAATADAYDQYLQDNYGDNAAKIKAQYPLSAFNSTLFPPIYAISQIVTASSFLCPARRGLETAAKNGVPVWTYRFSHFPKCSWEQKIPNYGVSLLGPTHSSEIPFVFNHTTALPPPNGTCEMTDDEKMISAFMTKAWTSMAAQQKPADDSDWPAWTDSTKSQGVNIVNSSQPGFVNYTECALWDEIDSETMANSTANGTSSSNGTLSTTTASGPAKTNSATSYSASLASALFWTAIVMLFGSI